MIKVIFGLSVSVCCLASVSSVGQKIDVVLLKRHIDKVNEQNDPAKKLALYRKLFKKDSIKLVQLHERYWRAQSDSLTDAMIARERALKKKEERIKDGINSKIYRTVYKPWAKKQAAERVKRIKATGFRASPSFYIILKNYLAEYFLQVTQNDSMIFMVKQQFPDMPLPKQLTEKLHTYNVLNADKIENLRQKGLTKIKGINQVDQLNVMQENFSGLSDEVNEVSKYGKAWPNTESAKALAEKEVGQRATDYAGKAGNLSEVKGQFTEAGNVKGLPGQYKAQVEQLQDSTYVKAQAKRKAEELAMKHLAEYPEMMQNVQRKMSKLMKRYSVVPNSNDLSTATKLSSLKGKTLFERLQLAANFQVINIDPVSIDLSPQAGYKVNRYLVVGIGGLYRKTFKDNVAVKAPDVLGYKGYITYEVLQNFLAYGEYARNSPGMNAGEGKTQRIWESALVAGMGRKFFINPKIETTIMLGYNFLHRKDDTVYPQPWSIRVGFQTSELAMMRKK